MKDGLQHQNLGVNAMVEPSRSQYPYKDRGKRPAIKTVKPKRAEIQQAADSRRQNYQTNERRVEVTSTGAVNTLPPNHEGNPA